MVDNLKAFTCFEAHAAFQNRFVKGFHGLIPSIPGEKISPSTQTNKHTSNSTFGCANLTMQYDNLVNGSDPSADPLLDCEPTSNFLVDEMDCTKFKV